MNITRDKSKDTGNCNYKHKMKTPPEFTLAALHNEAMRLVQEAILLNVKAFEMEKRAAMSLLEKKDKEPTRSILFKSAGWIALKCEMFQEAEQMARHGLNGNPPDEIRVELEDILQIAKDGTK